MIVDRLKPKYIYLSALIVAGLVLCVDVVLLGFSWSSRVLAGQVQRAGQPTSPRYYSALTGLPVPWAADELPQVVGSMIDNHADARPQSGLDQADVVYEAPVEGGITRYFALFASSTLASEVGPVRSARPYFLDWLQEYGDALYMHSGGSPDALQLIKDRNIFDANEFYYGSYYWRDAKRSAPHNLYTDSHLWQGLLAKRQPNRSASNTWEGWKFDAPSTPADGVPPVALHIRFTSSYTVAWKTVTSTGRFVRLVNDKPLLTREGKNIFADSVVFATMNVTTIDEYGRRAITTIGSGEAVVVKKGQLIHGTWKKESLSDRTRWYDADGQEITLSPGKIWIEIVPSDAVLTIESGAY